MISEIEKLESTQTVDPKLCSQESRAPVTILMIDDEPAKLLSYEVILKSLNENLVKATSAREAMAYLLKADVAVVLTDVSMPEIDGFELADMIRQHPRFEEIPIIFVSAVHLTDVDRIRGYQRGAVDYISVPVIPDVLRAKVGVFADLYRKTRQLQQWNRDLEARVDERNRELKDLNEQLQERVAELESIMRVLPVGVAIAHDRQCRLVTGNAALSRMFNLKTGDNLSTSLGEKCQIFCEGALVETDDLPLHKSVHLGKTTGIVELEIRREGSSPTFLLSSASPVFDELGDVRGAAGAFFDVTERKRMEQVLRERAELLDLASEAIIVRDINGVIQFWNGGAEHLYGWSRDEVIGLNIHELLSSKTLIDSNEMIADFASRQCWEDNLIQRTKSGKEIVVSSRQVIKLNSDLVLEINRDITSQLIAEEALRRSDRLAAMGKVAGIVAHEINNPLEAITNIFYLLRNHPTLDDDARYMAKLADQELTRVSHITKQTLSFYRESQSAVEVKISELVDDVLALQQRPLENNRIIIERKYSKTEACIQGFPAELKQVFMNLVSNAIYAMPAGGRLRIRVARTKERAIGRSGIQVSLTDTGSGISPEDAARLFEPFFTTKSTKGTGLGLWISKGIVLKHDGTLTFRSVFMTSGRATCFRVFLPD